MCDGILYTIRFIVSTTGTNSSYDKKEVHSCHSKDRAKSHRSHLEKAKFLSKICVSAFLINVSMAKAAVNKKRALFTSTVDLKLRKKLVKCYIWSTALYGAETWTLRTVDQKHLESFEMWC
jgi:hypothetical protein